MAPDRQAVTPEETAVIASQLGRSPRDLTGIAVRCPFGHAAVIETAPVLADGTPNPTLLYVTCPTLTAAVSRMEAGGGVRSFKTACAEDIVLQQDLDRVTHLYRQRRARLLGRMGAFGTAEARRARLEAGIGGPAGPDRASCLHAYGAALLAVMSGWLCGDGETSDPTAPDTTSGEADLTPEGVLAQHTWARFYPPLETCWCSDRRCDAAARPQRRAVIDVGTISVRLLVADVSGGRQIRESVRRTEITRMGEGLHRGGRLLPAAAERTAQMVGRFVAEARSCGAEAILVAGTSAAREASDGREFLKALATELGVSGVTLSGRQEAEAAYAGVTQDVPGDPVVLDIGGGSTELSRRRGIRFETKSLDMGASKATERWIAGDPPRPAEVAAVRAAVEDTLRREAGRFQAGERMGPLVGVAGTVTTVACLAAGLEHYDRDALHLSPLTRDDVERQLDRLSAMTTAERAALGCVQAGRAPVIVAGAAILLAVMDCLGFGSLLVSERDLLDGLVVGGPW